MLFDIKRFARGQGFRIRPTEGLGNIPGKEVEIRAPHHRAGGAAHQSSHGRVGKHVAALAVLHEHHIRNGIQQALQALPFCFKLRALLAQDGPGSPQGTAIAKAQHQGQQNGDAAEPQQQGRHPVVAPDIAQSHPRAVLIGRQAQLSGQRHHAADVLWQPKTVNIQLPRGGSPRLQQQESAHQAAGQCVVQVRQGQHHAPRVETRRHLPRIARQRPRRQDAQHTGGHLARCQQGLERTRPHEGGISLTRQQRLDSRHLRGPGLDHL